MTALVPAGVAAGNTQTAAAGLGVLADGGNAADAAAAMVLAGCVAETIFTGLGGGGFATYYDAATGALTCHDFFVAVPGLDGTSLRRGSEIAVSFGGVPVPYEVGGPTVAVPGTPVGVEHLHRAHGSLPWADVVRPARDLAATGTPFSEQHSSLLVDVSPAFMLGAGIEIYSTGQDQGRRLLQTRERLFHPGLAETLDRYAETGAAALMSGPFAAELVTQARSDGGALSLADLAAYRPKARPARAIPFAGVTVNLRGDDLDGLPATLRRLDLDAVRRSPADRTLALARALAGPARRSDTTSLVAVDRDGNACAATHSLGLGSGVWVNGVHANSMLGEGELLRGPLIAGERMGSMMSPLVVTGPDGRLLLAGGAAGGSRIRSALLQVLTAVLVDGDDVATAVTRPRIAVAGETVHLEPGFGNAVADHMREQGYQVVEWDAAKPYFGGVSMAGASGLAADPRRGGHALLL